MHVMNEEAFVVPRSYKVSDPVLNF